MWRIKQIFDGDYGCEEHDEKSGPEVTVYLTDESGREKNVRVPDKWLIENNLNEGDEWEDDDNLTALTDKRKYPVVTLCGSTRFKEAFMEAQKRLTLKGCIVISVGLFGHSGDEEVWENMDEGTLTKTKEMLDDMHKRKIDMADEIFVINVGDYIGESTRSEIEYAKAHGIPVRYLEQHIEG